MMKFLDEQTIRTETCNICLTAACWTTVVCWRLATTRTGQASSSYKIFNLVGRTARNCCRRTVTPVWQCTCASVVSFAPSTWVVCDSVVVRWRRRLVFGLDESAVNDRFTGCQSNRSLAVTFDTTPHSPQHYWLRGTLVERRFVTGELSLSYARPAADGWSLSLIHIWRCRRSTLCRSRWSPYH